MANLQEVYQYKNQIIKLLVNCDEIIKTINNLNIETADELIGNNIFKDLYIPDTQSEAKVYICVGVYIPRIYDKLIKNVELHIWIFSHQDIMNTDYGYTRVDYIQYQVDKLLNGNYNFGIDSINLVTSRMFKPNTKFGGVELIYDVPDINQNRCDGFDKSQRHN